MGTPSIDPVHTTDNRANRQPAIDKNGEKKGFSKIKRGERG
jgi:hypothetical protein